MVMVSEQHLEKLEAILFEELNVVVPTRETDLIAEGYIDSLMLVSLLFMLEERFDITIRLEKLDFDNFQSINTIADFVESQAQARGDGVGDAIERRTRETIPELPDGQATLSP